MAIMRFVRRKRHHHTAISSILSYGLLAKLQTLIVQMVLIPTTSQPTMLTWIMLWMAMVVAIQTSISFAPIQVHINISSTTSTCSTQSTQKHRTSGREWRMGNTSEFLQLATSTFPCLMRMVIDTFFNSRMLCMLLISLQISSQYGAYGKTAASKQDLVKETSSRLRMEYDFTSAIPLPTTIWRITQPMVFPGQQFTKDMGIVEHADWSWQQTDQLALNFSKATSSMKLATHANRRETLFVLLRNVPNNKNRSNKNRTEQIGPTALPLSQVNHRAQVQKNRRVENISIQGVRTFPLTRQDVRTFPPTRKIGDVQPMNFSISDNASLLTSVAPFLYRVKDFSMRSISSITSQVLHMWNISSQKVQMKSCRHSNAMNEYMRNGFQAGMWKSGTAIVVANSHPAALTTFVMNSLSNGHFPCPTLAIRTLRLNDFGDWFYDLCELCLPIANSPMHSGPTPCDTHADFTTVCPPHQTGKTRRRSNACLDDYQTSRECAL